MADSVLSFDPVGDGEATRVIITTYPVALYYNKLTIAVKEFLLSFKDITLRVASSSTISPENLIITFPDISFRTASRLKIERAMLFSQPGPLSLLSPSSSQLGVYPSSSPSFPGVYDDD